MLTPEIIYEDLSEAALDRLADIGNADGELYFREKRDAVLDTLACVERARNKNPFGPDAYDVRITRRGQDVLRLRETDR